MAKFSVYEDGIDNLFDIDFDEIAAEGLEEAAPILEKCLKDSARLSVEHEGDSEMVNYIKANKPKKAKNGAWIVHVGPKGASTTKMYRAKKTGRKYPVSNALKAIWKEYGIEGHQAPRPFITRATNQAKDAVYKTLQEVFDRKVEKDGSE